MISHRLGRNASTKQKIDLTEWQQHLQLRIDDFHARAAQHWPVDDEDLWLEGRQAEPPDILPSDSEEEIPPSLDQSLVHEGPKKTLILLPSNIGLARCIALGYESFCKQEKCL